MKNIIQNHLITRARHILLTLMLGFVLLSAVSCAHSGPDNTVAIKNLEGRFDQLESGLAGVVFWQATAALLFVTSVFALVGGAALGSRARRDRNNSRSKARSETTTPDSYTQ